MTKLVNLTPHYIGLVRIDGTRFAVPPSKRHRRDPKPPARVQIDYGDVCMPYEGVDVRGPAKVEGIVDLPPPEHGTIYIVSQITAMIAAALFPERRDIVFPGDWSEDAPQPDQVLSMLEHSMQNAEQARAAAKADQPVPRRHRFVTTLVHAA